MTLQLLESRTASVVRAARPCRRLLRAAAVEHLLQLADAFGGFVRRQTGGDDAFGFAHAALQADGQRQVLTDAHVGLGALVRTAQRLFGLGELL